MLKYMQGRFHLAGASFVIPEGFFLDSAPFVPADNGLSLHSPDDKYDLTLSFDNQAQSTYAMLNSLFSKEYGLKPFQPITPILINGLSGHYALYHGISDQYYEARFQLDENWHLVILVRTDNIIGIKNIVNAKDFHKILNCVQKG